MATPVRFGTEFVLNTTINGPQFESGIAGLAGGGFAASWTDQSGTSDPSATGIRAQVFNADGTVAGPNFAVNTTTNTHQNQPAITGLSDGRFVVSWTDQSASVGDTSLEAIRAQIFNADGSKDGGEILVNSITRFDQRDSAVTALANGRFVVTWKDGSISPDDASGAAVRAQIFDADGGKSGAEFRVTSTIAQDQNDPSITGLANGGFVACWMDWSGTGGPGGDPSGKAIRAQVFDANGVALGNLPDFVVNSTTAGNQHEPNVTALANGGFVVTWTDGEPASSDASVRAQVFDAGGARSGSEFILNTTSTDDQQDSAVAGLADGRFVASWVDFSATGGDTVGSAIRAQVFNTDGTKSGDEFLVNTITASNQSAPAIATLADGRFTISWTDNSFALGNNSAQDIRGQMFDPREAGVVLKGTGLADQWVGTGFKDRMSGAGGNDDLSGGLGADRLSGSRGNDELSGGGGGDKLTGGLGRDTMAGGTGADDFIFASAADTKPGAKRDVITDFEHLVDDIDLSSFLAGGSFIGATAFQNVAGQVRYNQATGILKGDADGNGAADFEIKIANKPVITSDDFIF